MAAAVPRQELRPLTSLNQEAKSAGAGSIVAPAPPRQEHRPVSVILNMIVKDEILTLPTLLDSVKDYVTDYVVVDTGSTDGTPQLLQERGITVHHKIFENFGADRNYALQLAVDAAKGRPAYIMLVDSDFELMVEDKEEFLSMLQNYEYDVMTMVQKGPAARFSNTRLVKAQLPGTHWVGAVHEYLWTNGTSYMELPMEIAWFKFYVDLTTTRPRDQKNQWYKTLLEADYDRDPTNGRTVFYLANTYREMGMIDKAIEKYHEKLAMSGQWLEEVVLSRHYLLLMYLNDKKDLIKAIEQADAIRISGRMRPEPFYELCYYYRQAGDLAESAKYLLLAQDGVRAARQSLPLFYVSPIESIYLPYEEYILWYYLHPDHLQLAQAIAQALLTNPDTPDWMKDSVTSNWKDHFCRDCPGEISGSAGGSVDTESS